MARIILNCSYDPPLKEFDRTLHPCFVARGVTWIRSFIAMDKTRSICELEAPYAEIVRDACRQADLPYEQVWRASVCQGQDKISSSVCSTPILSEVDYGTALTPEQWSAFEEPTRPCFQEYGIDRLCAWISSDGKQSLCLFAAANVETVQQAHHEAAIPFTRIWRSLLITP